MIDLYAMCPCGSGKKLKWCCAAIHEDLAKAFQANENGQLDVARGILDALTKQHPTNPEVWGRKAQLLLHAQQFDDADAALAEAFRLNPHYPLGFFLQAQDRLAQGDVVAGTALLRRAAQAYDPSAVDILARIYTELFEQEMQLGLPVAARATLRLALRNSVDPQVQETFKKVFESTDSPLPLCARREYQFVGQPASAPAEKKMAWEQALTQASTGRLVDATQAFETLARHDEHDVAAWHNYGLCRAWSGDNPGAVAALIQAIKHRDDPQANRETAALVEVLRQGHGMEAHTDFVEYWAICQNTRPEALSKVLEQWNQEKRLLSAQVDEQTHRLFAVIADVAPPALTPERQAAQPVRMACNLFWMGPILRLTNAEKAPLDRVVNTLTAMQVAPAEAFKTGMHPAGLRDVLSIAAVFPSTPRAEAETQALVTEGFRHFLEEVWFHRPSKSLDGVAPVDAAEHPTLRKRLPGIVDFLEQMSADFPQQYDFNRLRTKLRLDGAAPAPTDGPRAIGAMGPAQLAELARETLDAAELEEAFQTAVRLDAKELAAQFAQTAVSQAPRPDKTDRYALFHYLIQHASSNEDWSAALDYVNAGEADDCTHNGGGHRNDYELRRAIVLMKDGDHAEAERVFDRLIARVPEEAKYLVTAAESMLSARRKPQALKYAEAGLALARKQQNRDAEGHLQELAEAARR